MIIDQNKKGIFLSRYIPWIICFLFIFYPNYSPARNNHSLRTIPIVPLETQITNFKKNIKDKVNETLKPLVKEADYVVDIKITQKPNLDKRERLHLEGTIKSIDIKLTFTQAISKRTTDKIQEFTQRINFNIKEIVPRIEIQYVSLELKGMPEGSNSPNLVPQKNTPKNNENNKAEIKKESKVEISNTPPPSLSRFESLKNWAIIFSLIMNTFSLMGLIFVVLLKDAGNSEKSLPAISEQKIELHHDDGIRAFKKLLTSHHEQSILLIKKWVKVGKEIEASALRSLLIGLEEEELALIFKVLTLEERKSWSRLLRSDVDEVELILASTFIFKDITEFLVSPIFTDDKELCFLLLDYSIDQLAQLSIDSAETQEILGFILTPVILNNIFSKLPLEITSKILEKNARISKEEISIKVKIFKEKVMANQIKIASNAPIIATIIELLPLVNMPLEAKLYAILMENEKWENILKIALQTLPKALMHQIPDNLLKEIEDEKIFKIDPNFIQLTRNFIATSSTAQSSMQAIVESWLKEIKIEKTQDRKEELSHQNQGILDFKVA